MRQNRLVLPYLTLLSPHLSARARSREYVIGRRLARAVSSGAARTTLPLLAALLASSCASKRWANDLAPGVVYDPRGGEVSPAGALLFKYVGDRASPNAFGPTFMFGGSSFGVLGDSSDSASDLKLIAGAGFYIDADKFYVAFGWSVFPQPDAAGAEASGAEIGNGPFLTIGIQ